MAKKVKAIIEDIPNSDEGDGNGGVSGAENREDQDIEREKEDNEEIHNEMEKNEDSMDTHQLLNELSALANLDSNCNGRSRYKHVGLKRFNTRSSARK